MAIADKSIAPNSRLSWLRFSNRMWIALTIVAAVCLTSCIRFEVFASASDPPSIEWDGMFSTTGDSLTNQPIVVSTLREGNEVTVTVANQGTTALCYRAVGRSGIQVFWELEDWGQWTQAGWDWCGMGKENFELPPGDQVALSFNFEDPRRERMLGNFGEKGTERRGLVVLACESRRLTFDPHMSVIPAGAALASFGIWMTVRVVNRRTS